MGLLVIGIQIGLIGVKMESDVPQNDTTLIILVHIDTGIVPLKTLRRH